MAWILWIFVIGLSTGFAVLLLFWLILTAGKRPGTLLAHRVWENPPLKKKGFAVRRCLAAVLLGGCMLPGILLHSGQELPIRQTLLRNIAEIVLLELIVLGTQKVLSPSTSAELLLALGVSVLVIAAFVNLVAWLYDTGEARKMNRMLEKRMRK